MIYDMAVVGAGIVGLAHALAAAQRGKRVVVIDRDTQANGASIRNFGFVTVTGQQAGSCWARAMRSREVWAEIAPKAGIEVLQRGLTVLAERDEAVAVLEAFLATGMGQGCRMLTRAEAAARLPITGAVQGALHSPHELRVESRDAIPRLAAWLQAAHGVTFLYGRRVTAVTLPRLDTSAGPVEAETAVICPGDDFTGLHADRIAAQGFTRCLLHMLRVMPARPTSLPTPVMSDLGLARYLGYAELPEAAALKTRLDAEKAEARAEGVHLIAVQSADGSLVVGDSHRYDLTPPPFADARVDDLVLGELDAVLSLPGARVTERWTGTYASAPDRLAWTDHVSDAEKLVIVTSGTGASTAFAIAEETLDSLYGRKAA
ncbi:TIGR03364 family FAD-dependent oxidoreductase [Rhodobacteraceae bacterium W635]|uniref:TIGR03364 family FAD-dependent oxidoreductase n=1 Tax=Nioella halotolerans TaxID=2303578 RepID=UPI000E3CEF50|nr:TIGR03364 family FAD-dependent oxidoreductase [Rhodobacteraceae bacterium W635]